MALTSVLEAPSLGLLLLLALGTSAVEVKRPRGVSLLNQQFYEENKPFTCLDGSKTIPFHEVNDDYCDCKDGSDEPGTSACPNGNFHCTNAGHRPRYIPSSRVNDGICDCCDTSDEYNSGAFCINTCKEQGRKEREALQKMAEIAKEGFKLKQQLIEDAKRSREDKQQKLAVLQKEKINWETQVEALKTVKEAAEKPEQEAKERHKKAWEEVQAAHKLEKNKAMAAETFKELDDNEDGFITVNEIQTHPELDSDGDGVVSEQEAEVLLGGANQVDVTSFQETVWAGIQGKYKSEAVNEVSLTTEIPVEGGADSSPRPDLEEQRKTDDEDYGEDQDHGVDEDDSESDNEFEEEDDDDDVGEDDYKNRQNLSEKEEEEEEKMPAYDEETQVLIDVAEKARNEFSEAEKSLKEVESSIGSLEKELMVDFGPDGEFSYMFSQCYEMTTNEYIYKLCPFNKVAQKPKHGGTETSLGVWGSWAGPEDNKFSIMKYEHGTGCWQGPNRSTTVKLSCGKETAVLSTSEPSRCEYLMEFSTPAFCQEVQDGGSEHDEL
ncbi:glucosidase 2 subunit beta isoform X2 [Hypanus sabinus]|uniref:glucosidase 2 subunit beta isoform X2 n=1 Tax=Hypanus sabinus TaxID=79690 RepID=UPI0028C4B9DB|nr:glucosidase 2 subunit beta isoform X2 [Hypanus sabinus]